MKKTKIFRSLKVKSPKILTCLATAGVISTVVLAVRATPKAIKKIEKLSEIPDTERYIYKDEGTYEYVAKIPSKKDIFKAVWKDYIPAAATGVGTIICIFGANVLNKRNQAMLASAYAVVSNQFKRYSNEVVDRFGEETHEDIMNKISIEDRKNVEIFSPGTVEPISMKFDPVDENELLFYDIMSKRYFKSTIGNVMQAIHHLNRNFCMGGDPEVNMYYDFLGISQVDYGDNIGWSLEDGLYWIDFNIFKSKADDDTLEYYVIEPIFWPEPFPPTY